LPTPTPSRSSRNKRFRREKPAKKGTPIRNSLLILIFGAIVAASVFLLPQDPMQYAATVLVPGGENMGVHGQPMALSLRISEVMSSNKRAYPDEAGNYSDWLEVHNTGSVPVNLSGIGLSDREDRIKFLFPDIDLAAGEYIVVFCDSTNVSAKDKILHAQFNISALGESLYLFDSHALVIDSVAVPPLNSDTSYALTSSGWNTTAHYTPGYPNDDAGYDAFRFTASTSANGLVLNEVLASSRTTLPDEDGDYPDWIELYNGSSLPIDLSNYALSDNETNPVKWRFPQGSVIQPGEYYLVLCSGKDRPGENGRLPHANFRLSAEGSTVILSDILGHPIDRVTYDNLGTDESYGRVPGLEYSWQVFQQATPGFPNDRSGTLEMDRRIRAWNDSGVFISEVVTNSLGLDTPYGSTSYDWIELYNATSQPIDLTGWGLSDRIGHPRKWQFSETVIGAGQYLLVFASGLTASPTGSSALHAEFRLSALGETIVLSTPEGAILDKMVVPRMDVNTSYGRDFDRGGLFYYDTPTAGAKNTTQGFAGYAAKPTIDQKGTLITKPTEVTLSAPEGVHIRYTLDGSIPTASIGYDYTDPIVITATSGSVLRARGFQTGLKPSEVVTESFLYNAYHILPVISVTVDPDDLWNPLTGIYSDGDDETAFLSVPFKRSTYWRVKNTQAIRARDGNFEFYTPEGQQVLNQGVAVQLHGQYSMDNAQKSLRITAKSRYGTDSLAYPFFDDRPYSEYKALILRNGGNLANYERITDSLQSKIVDRTDTTIIHMASTPCIVYLNGEYWGQYYIRERINAHYIAMYEGWSNPEAIDLIKGDNNVLNGSFSDYKALLDYVKRHDLNNPEALERVLDWIDVDNYFDFYIFETYFGNTDPGNIKFYRQRVEGAKWRWILFDLDWGYFYSSTKGFNVWLNPKGAQGAGGLTFDNSIIVALLKVPEMREKFLLRYAELWPILTDAEQILTLVDEMVAEINPEMGMHNTRWAGETRPEVAIDPYNARDNALIYWYNRINRLKNIIQIRPYHVYTQMQEWFELPDEYMLEHFGSRPEEPR